MTDFDSLTSLRPYLLRAHHEWMVDNDLTPHLLVDADAPGVVVPRDFVREGSIVLNVAPRAVGHLDFSNDEVSFSARFNGVGMTIRVPMDAVSGLVARECGVGISFAEFDGDIVVDDDMDNDTGYDDEPISPPQLSIAESSSNTPEAPPDDVPPDGGPPAGGRPALRIVK
jgi:stringent starvation protein B